MFDSAIVWVRGAGELGSATALVLHRVGFRVLLSERAEPLAIRRNVCFCDAVLEGMAEVEGVRARRLSEETLPNAWDRDEIALVIDNPDTIVEIVQPSIMVDARMLKRASNLTPFAPITVGLGPGFEAGVHCGAVIETKRGHDLGRVLMTGSAAPNTGVPGSLGGRSKERVVYSPAAGRVQWKVPFGYLVEDGESFGMVDGTPIIAPFSGMVRGMISPQVSVDKGTKIADVDPRGEGVDFESVSDKARCVGRGVLEAVLMMQRGLE